MNTECPQPSKLPILQKKKKKKRGISHPNTMKKKTRKAVREMGGREDEKKKEGRN